MHNCFFSYYMIMIVISFALVKFYAFVILYVLTVMQIKLVVVTLHRDIRQYAQRDFLLLLLSP